MMRVEPCEEDQNIDIVLRSGIKTGADKGKQPEEEGWLRKVDEKEDNFDLNCTKEKFLEEKKNFNETSISGS